MSWYHPSTLLDKIFEGGIIIKGVSGALEFIAGLLLFFIKPAQIHDFIVAITQKELIEDPHDLIANALLGWTHSLDGASFSFLIAYLWIHAAVKLIAVVGILRNQLWAYPFSLITLGLLMVYQLYHIFFVRVSVGMILLTIFDVFILWLIWREYAKVRPQKVEADD
jgi:uncharacterized membrane protein